MIDPKYLHEILDEVTRISEGDYTTRIDIAPDQPELSAIAKGINKLVGKLESAHKKMELEREFLYDKKSDLCRIMENIGTGIFIVDPESKHILFCNKKAAELAGLEKEEILGKLVSQFLKQDLSKEGGNPEEGYSKNYIIDSRGKRIHVLESSVPLIHDGKPVLLKSVIDITKEIQVEEKLRESEKNFSDTIELMPKGIAISRYVAEDDDFYFTRFNRYAQKLEGMDEAYVMGKSMKELFPAVVQFGLFDKMKEVLKTGKPVAFPLALYQDENMCAYRENYIYQLTNGHIVCVYDDKTEKKRLENELKISQERYNLAIEGSSDGIWDWDLKTNDLYLSPSWKKQLGYEDHELENKFDTFQQLLHPNDTKVVYKRLNDYLRGNCDRYNVELRIKNKKGEYRRILSRAIMIRNEFGDPLRMSGVHTDITEMYNVRKELERNNKTKDRFFSIIAHDLRSPLGNLLGLSELMIRNYYSIDDDYRRKMLQTIHQSSKNTYDLIQNLLLWSRSQVNNIEYKPEILNIHDLIDNSSGLFSDLAKQKNITIRKKMARDCQVFADKNMMSTIIRNLVTNAIKFTPSGGLIDLMAEESSGGTRISIRDNGVGIKKENLEKLFRIDESFCTTGTNNEEGTGLGLVLCKDFIQRHNGSFTIDSQPGKGTTFSFLIPVMAQSRAEKSA